jgi:hypothetical protein
MRQPSYSPNNRSVLGINCWKTTAFIREYEFRKNDCEKAVTNRDFDRFHFFKNRGCGSVPVTVLLEIRHVIGS